LPSDALCGSGELGWSVMSKCVAWFHRVTFVGVLINVFGMALPFIFRPQWYLDLFELPGGGGSVIWMRQAGLLLLFISILYAFGGRDPVRYSWNAKFAVGVRMVIGLYWLWLVYVEGYTHAFLPFGLLDCGYAVINGFVLWVVLRQARLEPSTASPGMTPRALGAS
jgi:hypothetical protein